MQFQADLLHTKVARPQCIETTALGAAYLAGLAVGYWKSREDIKENWALGQEFSPKMEPSQREERLAGWKRAVKGALAWAKQETT
jgi:glycerol kinase